MTKGRTLGRQGLELLHQHLSRSAELSAEPFLFLARQQIRLADLLQVADQQRHTWSLRAWSRWFRLAGFDPRIDDCLLLHNTLPRLRGVWAWNVGCPVRSQGR